MTTYQPKDERLLNWDPENMDQYWQQCERFDPHLLLNTQAAEQQSSQAFASMQLNFSERKPLIF